MEIFNAIAKVSWDTNLNELKPITQEIRNQDKLLEELRAKGMRLNEQMIRTNDPKKVKTINDELQKTRKSVDAIIESQKKQASTLDALNKKQGDLIKQLRATSDPQLVQGLLQNLRRVENQMDALSKKTQSLPSKVGGIGASILQGFGIGAGMFSFEKVAQSITAFVGDSIAEFEDAQKSSLDLGRALKSIGQTKYFEGLKTEATTLADKFHGLFDNDEIIKAQTALVQYGKLSRDEMSKLLPVILNLASAEGIDLEQATTKVVNILEGRGGQTLRDYGLSVKGVKTEHDRLNLVLGEFNKKLQGAADTYATTAQGMEQINKVAIKNIEERFGESFSRVKSHVLPIITEILTGVNDIFDSFDAAGSKGDKLLAFTSMFNPGLANQLKAERLINAKMSKATDAGAKAGGFSQFPDSNKALNPNATTEKTPEEIAADKAREDAKKKRLEEQKKLNDELIKIRLELDAVTKGKDEQELNTINEKYRQLLNRVKEFHLDEKNLETLHSEELLNKKHEFAKRDSAILGQMHHADLTEIKKDHKEEVKELAKKGEDFLKQMIKDAASEEEVLKMKADKKKELKDKERQDTDTLISNANDLGSTISNIYTQEINHIDELIAAQQKRVDSAKNSSEASLKIEQNRLDELTKKRTRYERQQRAIDAAVIIANQAVAISAAVTGVANAVKSGNALLIGANIVAILAALGAGYSAVRSVTQQSQGFKDGGYTGDGDPSEQSNALGSRGYLYHKKEYVMPESVTTKHRRMLEGIHKGELQIQQTGNGYFLMPRSIDPDAAIANYQIAKSNPIDTSSMEYLLSAIDQKLAQRETNISIVNNEEGMAANIAYHIGRANLINKMRS